MGKKEKFKSVFDNLFGPLENHKFEEVKEALDKYDIKENFHNSDEVYKKSRDIGKDLDGEMDFPLKSKRIALGFDILGYSRYTEEKQNLVPFALSLLLDATYESVSENEEFLFYMFDKESFRKGFIHTGDGGFLILPNPLYGIVFALHFEMNLRSFNSGRIYPYLSKFIGRFDLRYAMSYGDVFHYDNNFFGPAIITASRIISRDKLNRFLMDQNSFDYFLREFNGIETLSLMSQEMILRTKSFQDFDKSKFNREGFVIGDATKESPGIENIFIQNIGKIDVKDDKFNIYNFFCQFSFDHYEEDSKEPNQKYNRIRVSLGNLNPQGLV